MRGQMRRFPRWCTEIDGPSMSRTPLRLGSIAALLLATAPASADWVLPPGATADLGGGVVSMGCTDVLNSGSLTLGAGGALVAARDVSTQAGALLALGNGRVELARQWSSSGQVTASSGQVLRTASPGCPLAGQAGPVHLGSSAGAPLPVPATGGWALALLSLLLAGMGRRMLSKR